MDLNRNSGSSLSEVLVICLTIGLAATKGSTKLVGKLWEASTETHL